MNKKEGRKERSRKIWRKEGSKREYKREKKELRKCETGERILPGFEEGITIKGAQRCTWCCHFGTVDE